MEESVQVCGALGADPVDLPAMAAALRYIGIGLTREVDKIREEACHSLPIALKAAPFKPFYDSSLQSLSELSAAVQQRGPSRLTTYERDEPQVGLHDYLFVRGTVGGWVYGWVDVDGRVGAWMDGRVGWWVGG